MVAPTEADLQELRDAIADGGYTPVPLEAAKMVAKPATAGSCCGYCRCGCRRANPGGPSGADAQTQPPEERARQERPQGHHQQRLDKATPRKTAPMSAAA